MATFNPSRLRVARKRRLLNKTRFAEAIGVDLRTVTGYERGAPIPSTLQILQGAEPALNTAAVVDRKPGEAVEYSGLGYTMIELAMVERLGRPFERIVDESVFRPLNMRNSTFAQTLPEALATRAARGHFASGAPLPGGWNIYPELAAAGLRTAPQPFRMKRQYELVAGSLRIGGRTIDVVPQWWPPPEPARFEHTFPSEYIGTVWITVAAIRF